MNGAARPRCRPTAGGWPAAPPAWSPSVLVTISVGLGLTMAGKVMRRPGLSRKLLAIHEQTALAGLVAIAVHGITLLGDPWLNPGVAGITVPSRWATGRSGPASAISPATWPRCSGSASTSASGSAPRLWRKAHRATVVVYVLGLVHALGAGTDASRRGCAGG